MPGLFGILSLRPRAQNEAELTQMGDAMCHEDFHKTGAFVNDKMGLYAGWVSVGETFADCMPVWNEKKNCLLLFTGRHFFDKEDVAELKKRNHAIRNQDASILVHMYEEKGVDFVKGLNGVFAGLVLDLGKKNGFLFGDRFGLERLYCCETRDAFYFASEAKALLKVLPELASVSAQGLAELASCDCVLDNRTLFNGISAIPPASIWSFEAGRIVDRAVYFKPEEWEQQTILGEEYFYGRLEDLLTAVMPRYFRWETSCGIALSGGLGSRLLLDSVELPQGKMPCYTYSGMYRETVDVPMARSLADAVKQTHQVLVPGKEFIENFASYAERAIYLTDGTALATGAADLYLASVARGIAPSAVSGRFLRQTLAGSRELRPATPYSPLFQPELSGRFAQIAERFATRTARHSLSVALFDELPRLHHGRWRAECTQQELRAPFLDKDLLALLFRAPEEVVTKGRLQARLRANQLKPQRKLPADVAANHTFLKSLYSRFLRKGDRIFSGMESDPGGPFQSLQYLPGAAKKFLGRYCYTHFRVWYRHELANWTKEVLLDPRSLARPYVNRKEVETIVRKHMDGSADHTREISFLLTAELFHRSLIEGPGRSSVRAIEPIAVC